MAVSARASRALHQALGDEAGEDVVNWMSEMEINSARMHDRMELQFDRVMTAIAELRTEIRGEIRTEIAVIRTEIKSVEASAERRYNDLLKWSFVFWVGAVAAIAALAGVLRS